MPSNSLRPSGTRPIACLAALVVCGILVSGAVSGLFPDWFASWHNTDARSIKRQAAVAFLDGLLIAYGPAVAAAILGTIVLGYLRWRGPLSSLRARLFLLCASVLVGILVLEAGAGAWRAWLHDSSILPPSVLPAQTAGASASRVSVASPSLPHEFTAPLADAGARPLKFLVIGESSGRGEPYHPWLSVGQIVAWRLEQVFPGRRIDVDIWATGGATLEVMHHRLSSLTYRPDALIVYVGHNEFQARYAWMRDVDHYIDADRPARVPLYPLLASLAQTSFVCRLIEESRQRQLVDLIPPRTVTRELVDRPLCTVAEAAAILTDFEHRLEAIADYCETIKTLPIFVIPPANDAGFDPSRSVLAPETTKDQRVALARAVSRARVLETKNREQAIRDEQELVKKHPEFAELHYRLARLFEQIGAWDLALSHYADAREADAMPLRCPEPLREAYRGVASRHPQVMLIDGPRVFAAESPHGIVDDRFFHDAQHPNLRGYAALAEDVLSQLHARAAFGWPAAAPVPIVNLEDCARHFQIDAARWATICSRGAAFFRVTAFIRYDPKFRNERSAAYQRALAAIRAGVAPDEAGIPGWPLPPEPATSHVIPVAASP